MNQKKPGSLRDRAFSMFSEHINRNWGSKTFYLWLFFQQINMVKLCAAVKDELQFVISPVVSELGLLDFSGFESGRGIRCKPVLYQHFHSDAADVRLSFNVRAKVSPLADFVQFIVKGVAWIPLVGPVYI